MRGVILTQQIKIEVSVPFASIYYPNDSQAEFAGKIFARRAYTESVHYQTCLQLSEQVPLEELAYFQWTIEKLKRFGADYERFLFAGSKGCAITEITLDEVQKITDVRKRHEVLAKQTTVAFVSLFESITANWDPNKSKTDIAFQKLPGNRFTVIEGRHRVAILMYKYKEMDNLSFLTDAKNISKGYISKTIRHYLRRWFKSVLSFKQV